MSDYEVGYKKPPQHTQFAKGQSGNPKGRKKGTKNLSTDIQAELSQYISISENGKTVRMSKQRVMVKSLCSKAIKGDTQSVRVLTNLLLKLTSQVDEEEQEVTVSESDQEIIDRYMTRHDGEEQ